MLYLLFAYRAYIVAATRGPKLIHQILHEVQMKRNYVWMWFSNRIQNTSMYWGSRIHKNTSIKIFVKRELCEDELLPLSCKVQRCYLFHFWLSVFLLVMYQWKYRSSLFMLCQVPAYAMAVNSAYLHFLGLFFDVYTTWNLEHYGAAF